MFKSKKKYNQYIGKKRFFPRFILPMTNPIITAITAGLRSGHFNDGSITEENRAMADSGR